MTRIVLGAIALAALAVAAFEVRRIAAGLDVTPEADEVVGMPTTHVHIVGVDPSGYRCVCGAWSRWNETHWCSPTTGTSTDWDAWFHDNSTHNPDWRN